VRSSAATVALFACACAWSSARAQDSAAAFYRGKTVQFFTMGSPGGGYDAYTRAIAARLEKSTGARVVAVNEPAAGGLVAMNRLLSARPDGLAILLIGGEGLALASLMGEPGVNYDLANQAWLARVSAETKVALLGPKSPYKTLGDMASSERPVVWAGAGRADGNTDYQALLAYATGMKAKIVLGYKGTGGMNLAMETGEVDGRVVTDEAAALYGPTSGMRVVGAMSRQRAAAFPDAPTIFEAVKLTPDAERILDWRAGIAALGRVVNMTPGSPADRVDYMRGQLKAILTDPDFIAEAKKLGLSAAYASGEDLTKMMAAATKTLDARGLDEIKDIVLNRYY
jgi:tripartite-type tricarboxylate transporter receptor subunit TctC